MTLKCNLNYLIDLTFNLPHIYSNVRLSGQIVQVLHPHRGVGQGDRVQRHGQKARRKSRNTRAPR